MAALPSVTAFRLRNDVRETRSGPAGSTSGQQNAIVCCGAFTKRQAKVRAAINSSKKFHNPFGK
jgi:hypothetical protein